MGRLKAWLMDMELTNQLGWWLPKEPPMSKTPWTDDHVMTWGPHKGTKLGDVPETWLLWCLQQDWIVGWPGLHAYLQENKDTLMQAHIDEEREKGDVEGAASYEDYLRWSGD